jgi:hypothetical protein
MIGPAPRMPSSHVLCGQTTLACGTSKTSRPRVLAMQYHGDSGFPIVTGRVGIAKSEQEAFDVYLSCIIIICMLPCRG